MRPIGGAMIVPMLGNSGYWRGKTFVVERLYWRGKSLPLGMLRLRWLLPASRAGYPYPGKKEPDVIDRPSESSGRLVECESAA